MRGLIATGRWGVFSVGVRQTTESGRSQLSWLKCVPLHRWLPAKHLLAGLFLLPVSAWSAELQAPQPAGAALGMTFNEVIDVLESKANFTKTVDGLGQEYTVYHFGAPDNLKLERRWSNNSEHPQEIQGVLVASGVSEPECAETFHRIQESLGFRKGMPRYTIERAHESPGVLKTNVFYCLADGSTAMFHSSFDASEGNSFEIMVVIQNLQIRSCEGEVQLFISSNGIPQTAVFKE